LAVTFASQRAGFLNFALEFTGGKHMQHFQPAGTCRQYRRQAACT
jgi:hypothetical protein